MAVLHPRVERHGLELVERVTDDFGPPFIEPRLSSLNVPFPGSGLRAFDDIGETLPFIGEASLRPKAKGDVFDDRH